MNNKNKNWINLKEISYYINIKKSIDTCKIYDKINSYISRRKYMKLDNLSRAELESYSYCDLTALLLKENNKINKKKF